MCLGETCKTRSQTGTIVSLAIATISIDDRSFLDISNIWFFGIHSQMQLRKYLLKITLMHSSVILQTNRVSTLRYLVIMKLSDLKRHLFVGDQLSHIKKRNTVIPVL